VGAGDGVVEVEDAVGVDVEVGDAAVLDVEDVAIVGVEAVAEGAVVEVDSGEVLSVIFGFGGFTATAFGLVRFGLVAVRPLPAAGAVVGLDVVVDCEWGCAVGTVAAGFG